MLAKAVSNDDVERKSSQPTVICMLDVVAERRHPSLMANVEPAVA